MRRECREEIGAEVEVQHLMHVADYYKQRETVPPKMRHQIEFIFRCRVSRDYVATNGIRPDKHQQDVLWLDRHSDAANLLWPETFRRILQNGFAEYPVILG